MGPKCSPHRRKHTWPVVADVVHESAHSNDLAGAGMGRSGDGQQVIRMRIGTQPSAEVAWRGGRRLPGVNRHQVGMYLGGDDS